MSARRWLLPVSLALVTACEAGDGVDARYRFERLLYEATLVERTVYDRPTRDTHEETQAAIAAYDAVLAANPLKREASRLWSPLVRRDIERVSLRAQTSLLRLHSLEFGHHAGVAYLRPVTRDNPFHITWIPEARLERVKEVYGSIDPGSLDRDAVQCVRTLGDVLASEVLWTSESEFGDSLLWAPIPLVEAALDNPLVGALVPATAMVESLLTEAVRTWPDSLTGARATLARAALRALVGRYEESLADLTHAIRSDIDSERRAPAQLASGELLAYALGRPAEGDSVFGLVRTRYPRTDWAYEAELHSVVIALRGGRVERADERLREIQFDDRVPPAVASRAMLVRALQLERSGNWEDAANVLVLICRLFPNTTAAVEAPLISVRIHARHGDANDRENALNSAKEFYLQFIEKDSAAFAKRHVLKDYLVECYLVMDEPGEIAELLEEKSAVWPAEDASVALFKASLIYLNIIGDRKKAENLLKKSIASFPEVRYARLTRMQLDRMLAR